MPGVINNFSLLYIGNYFCKERYSGCSILRHALLTDLLAPQIPKSRYILAW
jgi:hypothetical protein